MQQAEAGSTEGSGRPSPDLKLSEWAETFLLLAGGAALHCLCYASIEPENRLGSWPALLPILFGLPFLVREARRRTNWSLVLFFLVWVPAAHYAAVIATIKIAFAEQDPGPFFAGAAGGLIGGGLSFLVLALPGLRAPGVRAGPTIAAGLLVLALIGGIGLKAELNLGLDRTFALYLPWQLVFALLLAKLLLPSPPRPL